MRHTTSAGRLSREKIVGAVTELLEHGGVDGVSTRTIGEALDVHPTALYRHFRDMDELLREAADSILVGVADASAVMALPDSLDAAAAVCRGLRTALMHHPGAARVMASGPSRMTNERALTERLLGLLADAGLGDQDVTLAYHVLIEFTVGSAAINTLETPGTEEEVAARHRAWRADYLVASPKDFPYTTRFAPLLYPSLDDQFSYGLELMICDLRRRVRA